MCCQKTAETFSYLHQAKENNPCIYSLVQIRAWRNLLICFRKQRNVDVKQINKYLGIVTSSISYRENFCYFKEELTTIEPFITLIINSQKCG